MKGYGRMGSEIRPNGLCFTYHLVRTKTYFVPKKMAFMDFLEEHTYINYLSNGINILSYLEKNT